MGAGSGGSHQGGFGTFLRELETTEYFIPAVYMLQGIFMLALPLLASMDHPFKFTNNLGNAAAPWTENSFYLPVAAGLLLITASILRNSERTTSAIIALQGTVGGAWFGFVVLFASGLSVFLRGAASKPDSADFGGDVLNLALLGLFFFPLVFTLFYSIAELLRSENGATVVLRLLAGCCEIALLRLFRWKEVGDSVEASLFLIGGCLGYALTAIHPRVLYFWALVVAALCSSLTLIIVAIFFVLPDFSGNSLFQREQFDIAVLFLANIGLVFAIAVAFASGLSGPRKRT